MEFSAAAVAASIDAEMAQVEEQCAGLVRREQFLRARGTSEWPDGTVAARYGFLHALYQQVGYGQVPLGRRIELHRRLGEWEKAAYGERAGEIAAELAVHFERGRDYRRAVQYLHQAGENAIRRSAYVEAIGHLTRGLKLLRTLPDTPERAQHELRLQITLGAPLMATKGWGAPAVGTAYARAWALCQKLENPPQLFPVLFGLWVFYYTRAQLPTAQKLAEQLLHLAHRVQAPPLLLEAHHALGNTLHRRGELATARAYLEQGIALPAPGQHHSSAFLFGLNTGVVGLGYGTFVLWALGYPDQALQRSQAMLTLAEDLSHPLSLAWALNSAAWLHYLRREGPAAHERAGVALALCSEHGFAQLRAVVSLVWGWALAEQGQAAEGIVQMGQGLAAVRATGAEIGRPRALAMLAEAYGQLGQGEEGLSLVAKALAVVDRTGERFDEAELYRLKGELLLNAERGTRNDEFKKTLSSVDVHRSSFIVHRSAEAEAEECFWRAIEIARRQSAKSLELRAVMSLSRLWQHQGKKEEARQMLAEIYGWFTEGFDTADLQEAKALLEELSGRHEVKHRLTRQLNPGSTSAPLSSSVSPRARTS